MDEQQEPKTVRQDFLLPSKSSRLGTVKLEEIYLVGNYPNEISAGKELGRYIRYNQGQSKIVDAAASAAAVFQHQRPDYNNESSITNNNSFDSSNCLIEKILDTCSSSTCEHNMFVPSNKSAKSS